MMVSSLARSLDGRTRQIRLRKPRSRSSSTTRTPMKPAAPVTRIRSSGPMTQELHLPSVAIVNPLGKGAIISVVDRRRRPVRAHPFLQNDDAKEKLVIVAPTSGMLIQQCAHNSFVEVLVDPGITFHEHVGHLAGQSAAKPV